MTLLLIWRHLEYYAETREIEDAQGYERPSSLRFVVVPDATTFQHEASLALERILGKIENIELVSTAFCYKVYISDNILW